MPVCRHVARRKSKVDAGLCQTGADYSDERSAEAPARQTRAPTASWMSPPGDTESPNVVRSAIVRACSLAEIRLERFSLICSDHLQSPWTVSMGTSGVDRYTSPKCALTAEQPWPGCVDQFRVRLGGATSERSSSSGNPRHMICHLTCSCSRRMRQAFLSFSHAQDRSGSCWTRKHSPKRDRD